MEILYALILVIFGLMFVLTRKENIKNIDAEHLKNKFYIPFYKMAANIFRHCYKKEEKSVFGWSIKKTRQKLKILKPLIPEDTLIYNYYVEKTGMILLILFIGTLMSLSMSTLEKNKTDQAGTGENYIQRNAYGAGSKIVTYMADIAGILSKKMEIQVNEQKYSKEQVESLVSKFIDNLEELILGENKNLSSVHSKLNLEEQILDYPFELQWESSDIEILKTDGTVTKLPPGSEGKLVKITCYISFENSQWIHSFYVKIIPGNYSSAEYLEEQLILNTKMIEADTQEDAGFYLPQEIEGTAISWKEVTKDQGINLFVAALAVCFLAGFLKEKELEKMIKTREEQMMTDYPDFVNKLSLYLMAGMSVRSAWRKITMDYQKSCKNRFQHPVLEELMLSCRELDSGITECEVYNRFGNRNNMQKYRKLGALLSQNLRKGSRDILQKLEDETKEVFEDRKRNARKQGEEASTKLLFPMMIMLAAVMIMIMAPAFLTL